MRGGQRDTNENKNTCKRSFLRGERERGKKNI